MRYLILTLCVCLGACATPYQEMGFRGGVDATQLAGDTWRISAKGNGFTNPTRVQDFVLLRASQLAIANGYSHFALLGTQDTTSVGSFTTPGSYSGTTTVNATAFGNMAYGTANTTGTYIPAQTHTFIKPGADVMVKLLNAPPPSAPALEAQVVYNSLAPKYL